MVRAKYTRRKFSATLYVILLAALGPGVYSASNRSEYQKQEYSRLSIIRGNGGENWRG
jgi:hypothetical protein